MSLDIIEKSVFILLNYVDVNTFLRYAYTYLKLHPEQAPKVYKMVVALKELIETEFSVTGDKV